MRTCRRALVALPIVCLLVMHPALAQTLASSEPIDYDAIYRIKDEGLQRSKVMETVSYLTDVYGPRLTGSPNIKQAADWAVTKLSEWGAVESPPRERGVPFGRGWVNQRFSAQVLTPTPWPIIGFPKAWTPGTQRPGHGRSGLRAHGVGEGLRHVEGQAERQDRDAHAHARGGGAVRAAGQRYTDEDLEELEARRAAEPLPRRRRSDPPPFQFSRKRTEFLVDEGVLATFEPGDGDGGTFFVQQGGAYSSTPPTGPYARTFPAACRRRSCSPSSTTAESPGRWRRRCRSRCDRRRQHVPRRRPQPGFNIVAEIPGTDKADEIVMLGAHFDSWHAGTGATDNAAGSAVMMEAMRILKATGCRLRRTVRIGAVERRRAGAARLAGVRARSISPTASTMQLKPEHAKLAGYFNVDNGTGAIRGVYLQGNEAVAPIFALDGAVREPRDDDARRSATRAAPITCRSMPSGCRASSSSRIRWSTTRAPTTRTWTSTSGCSRPT